jgi:formylglycine-generating enzyme required for sulfatase activity
MAILCFTGIAIQVYAADNIVNSETILWSVVQKKNATEGYEVYLVQFPDGKFAAVAKAAIKKIKADKLLQEENGYWAIVQDSEDGNSVQKFIDKYPNGANIVAAKIKLATIRKIEKEFKVGQTFKGCATCPEMVIVPAGNFIMGNKVNAHRVTFASPFAIGKKEVTQKEWIAVMGSNPSKFKDCVGNCPVDNVSWSDATEFINKLNIKTGKEYRLPSEAEWEYACRAGTQQEYCGSNDANSVAWSGVYEKNINRASRPVAVKKANAWGLYDMSGNVAEWTEDGYHENFAGSPVDGTAWQGDGRGYVLRGGSWEGSLDRVRAVYRDFDGPTNRDVTYGFRIARKFP